MFLMMHLFSVNHLSPRSIIISFNLTFLLDPFQQGTEWPWLNLISHECTVIVAITPILYTMRHSLSLKRHLMTCCETISRLVFKSWLLLKTDFTLEIQKKTSKWPFSLPDYLSPLPLAAARIEWLGKL